jgi:hypothetical protein
MMIHTGIDERDYWYSAKALTQKGIEYPYVNHRTVRWGVIIPVAFQQLITGIKPNAYYVMPLINSIVQTVLLYALGKKIKNKRTGFIAAVLLIFFPYQIRAASQVRPEIFSMTYILIMIYFLYVFLFSGQAQKKYLSLFLASLFLFIAYLTKITNLFFLPAVFVLFYIYSRRRFIINSTAFGGILFILFIAETFLYRKIGGYKLGQLSVIIENHVADMETLDSFLQIFLRYSFENLQPYWHIPFILFFISAFYAIFKSKVDSLIFLIVPVFCFFFFITFTISGVHPLKMAEPFVNRYFCAVLPMVFLVLAWHVEAFISKYSIFGLISRKIVPIVSLGTLSFIVIFSQSFMPSFIKFYIHAPFDRAEHPFHLNNAYGETINNAWKNNIPIAAADGHYGRNALYTAGWYYLSQEYYANGRAPEPEISRIQALSGFLTLGSPEFNNQEEVLAAVVRPFRVKMIKSGGIARLQADSFNGL